MRQGRSPAGGLCYTDQRLAARRVSWRCSLVGVFSRGGQLCIPGPCGMSWAGFLACLGDRGKGRGDGDPGWGVHAGAAPLRTPPRHPAIQSVPGGGGAHSPGACPPGADAPPPSPWWGLGGPPAVLSCTREEGGSLQAPGAGRGGGAKQISDLSSSSHSLNPSWVHHPCVLCCSPQPGLFWTLGMGWGAAEGTFLPLGGPAPFCELSCSRCPQEVGTKAHQPNLLL